MDRAFEKRDVDVIIVFRPLVSSLPILLDVLGDLLNSYIGRIAHDEPIMEVVLEGNCEHEVLNRLKKSAIVVFAFELSHGGLQCLDRWPEVVQQLVRALSKTGSKHCRK